MTTQDYQVKIEELMRNLGEIMADVVRQQVRSELSKLGIVVPPQQNPPT